jgi:hypothetical protein
MSTYYWEHPTDQTRYLRSRSARAVAETYRRQGGEIGVIGTVTADPLRIVCVSTGDTTASVADLASRLVAARRALA